MQSIKYIPASTQATNASQMTVQTFRAPGATSIITNTVSGVPTFFFGSMGAPHTFIDPVTGETITVISEATAVDFVGTVNSGHVDIVAIAPGYSDTRGSLVGDIIVVRPTTAWADNIYNILNAGALNDNGTLAPTALDAFYRPTEVNAAPFVYSGGVIAQTTLLIASFSDIIYYIGGTRYTKTGVANRTYTINKDTYVDIDITGTVTYTEVANNANSPTLAANSIRLGIVVTNATTITGIVQGQIGVSAYTLPSPGITHTLSVNDSLGNLIYPTPGQKLIGYSQTLAAWGATTSLTDLTWLTVVCSVPAMRRLKLSLVNGHAINGATAPNDLKIYIFDGAVPGGTQLGYNTTTLEGNGHQGNVVCFAYAMYTTAAVKTFRIGIQTSAAAATLQAATTEPVALAVEIV